MEYRYSICVLNFNFSSFILDEFVSKSTNFREVFKEWRQENEEDFNIYYTIENEETEEFAIIKVYNDGSNESDDDFDVMNIDEFKELIWNDMRKSKEPIREIAFDKNKYVQTTFEHLRYFYMFKWNGEITREERCEINNMLKHKSYDEIINSHAKNDIIYGYKKFDKYIGFENFDFILYPDISRNKFVHVMIDLLKERFEKNKEYKNYKAKFYEIKKTNPKTITFEFDEKRNYNYDEVKNKLEEIRKLDYFSIARNSGKCRREVRNFLEINNDELIKALKTANVGAKVLIVDDIVTTGSTIKEILRKIKPINDKLDISLLSFIGKKGIGHG